MIQFTDVYSVYILFSCHYLFTRSHADRRSFQKFLTFCCFIFVRAKPDTSEIFDLWQLWTWTSEYLFSKYATVCEEHTGTCRQRLILRMHNNLWFDSSFDSEVSCISVQFTKIIRWSLNEGHDPNTHYDGWYVYMQIPSDPYQSSRVW